MVRPRKKNSDSATELKRQQGRERQKRYLANKEQKRKLNETYENATEKKKKGKKRHPGTQLIVPPSTLPKVMAFQLPAPKFRATPIINQLLPERKRERNDAQERLWCARSRHKTIMARLLTELEETLVRLKDSGFTRQKRGGSDKSSFNWQLQFDIYNHSVRHRLSSGYQEGHPDTRPHNIQARPAQRVRFHSREQMVAKLEGTTEQKELQSQCWDFVDRLIDSIPPLKEWTGQDFKVQFSMMTIPGRHSVKPHKDSADIAPQFSLYMGDYTGGELLTWEKGRQSEHDPHLSTDVRNKLLFFDGRLKHAANTWQGSYRINLAFYKHYDRRWTEVQPIQELPLLVMDFNKQKRK